jgi:adenylate kinase family enzyme
MPVPTDPSARPRRVLVYGVTGSGKSTAAARIAQVTGLPLVQVDDLTWQPGWVAVPEAEQRRVFAGIVAGEEWVLDSAYSAWLDLVLPRAELVVGLDYPRWFSLQRLLRRTLARLLSRELICNGNREGWRMTLGPESIVRWHVRSFASRRRLLRRWAQAPDGPPVLLIGRRGELERWLDSLAPAAPGQPGIGAAGS